jgi:hypothetical protein
MSMPLLVMLLVSASPQSVVIDTDFAVLRRAPGRETALDGLTNTQAVLFRGDTCTRGATLWTCDVDGVKVSGHLDDAAFAHGAATTESRLDVQGRLRAAGGDGQPSTPREERMLVLSSFAAYRIGAAACRGGRCDEALRVRLNLFATAHALAGPGLARVASDCAAGVEDGACVEAALGAGVVGLELPDDTPRAFAWASAVDAERVRFVLGSLEPVASGRRVVITVDETLEDGLFPRVGGVQVALGSIDVLNPHRRSEVASLLLPARKSLAVQRRFARGERVTVVCSDRVVRTALGAPKLRLREVEDLLGVTVELVYALPCAAGLVLVGDVPEISDGALASLGRVPLPAVPPWRARSSVSWRGDLNRDGVVDVITRYVGEMGCGEHELWLSRPGGSWVIVARNGWYC